MFQPQIPDRAGRGRLCAELDLLVKELRRAQGRGDTFECHRILARLSAVRARFHKLYNFTPRPEDATDPKVPKE